MRADSFIPIYECMVSDKTEAQTGGLLHEEWVSFFTGKRLERGIYGGLQHPFLEGHPRRRSRQSADCGA